jgi:hypothetical protein
MSLAIFASDIIVRRLTDQVAAEYAALAVKGFEIDFGFIH